MRVDAAHYWKGSSRGEPRIVLASRKAQPGRGVDAPTDGMPVILMASERDAGRLSEEVAAGRTIRVNELAFPCLPCHTRGEAGRPVLGKHCPACGTRARVLDPDPAMGGRDWR